MNRIQVLTTALAFVLTPTSMLAAESDSLQERHAIRGECERIVYTFLHFLEGEHAKTADLFTEDGQAFDHVGREKIRDHFSDIEAKDHNVNVLLSSNLTINVRDEDHATGSGYVTHYTAKPEGQAELTSAKSITRWSWEFTRVDGEWLISKMKYPESVLLRKDAIEALQRQSK